VVIGKNIDLKTQVSNNVPPGGQPPVPTVFVIDDDVSFLRSVSRLLGASGFHVVMHNSAAEFLMMLKPETPGCVVSDLKMPGMDGMALQDALRNAGNPLPILFLTGHGDIPLTVRAMRQGAEDFLTKRAPKEELVAAVKRALAANEKERAARERQQQLRAQIDTLTDREREVLEHVIRGQLNKQIAADLGIHERTVKLHRTSITAKLGVHSVAELTRLWIEANNWP
jgi:FixJ family two-component response regulator